MDCHSSGAWGISLVQPNLTGWRILWTFNNFVTQAHITPEETQSRVSELLSSDSTLKLKISIKSSDRITSGNRRLIFIRYRRLTCSSNWKQFVIINNVFRLPPPSRNLNQHLLTHIYRLPLNKNVFL